MTTLNLLKTLVFINSVYPNEQKLSQNLANYLQALDFTVKTINTYKNRPNIVATFGNSKNYLAFYAHMDTVHLPKGVKNPRMYVEGNKAYGRGVEDMKGGIAIILKAAEFAKKRNLPLKIVFGVDEENISEGAHDLIDSGLMNDISFLISAESGQIQNLNKPFNVCFGRKGRILYQINVNGKKSHAAEEGVNAIECASRLIEKITKLEFKDHPRLGRTKIVIQSISAETNSFTIPDYCQIQLSLLNTPLISRAEFKKKINQLGDELHCDQISIDEVQRKTPYADSYEVDKENYFLKELDKKIFEPNKIKPIYTTSVADENIFANKLKIPVISIGPIGGGSHTDNEWLDLNSLHKTEEAFKQIIDLFHADF